MVAVNILKSDKQKWLKAIEKWFKNEHVDGRYKSWEHCYDAVKNVENNTDYLALQLAFYLASWGMYRGSSFLLKHYDYKIHVEAVEKIRDYIKEGLREKTFNELPTGDNYDKLFELTRELSDYYFKRKKKYNDKAKNNKNDGNGEPIGKNISQTLITKIILGTIGCVPAYDTYFMEGIDKFVNEKGVRKFDEDHYKYLTEKFNSKDFKGFCNEIRSNGIIINKGGANEFTPEIKNYPNAKLLDMIVFVKGSEIFEMKKKQKKFKE